MNPVSQRSAAVLINVDDHEPARYARTRVLVRAGFEVHDAATGTDALRLIAETAPDLVLLDVHLPDMSGIEVCRHIKHQEQTSGVIVLQISASAISAPQATVALDTGADAYLIEPVDPDVLVATVRAFLRLRATERDLARANRELSAKNAELQRLNHALRRSNDDLEWFAFIASHDLQEPLRNIIIYVQLLESLTASRFNDTERGYFRIIAEGGLRMGLLIRDVLAYSGIGREVPVLKPTNLDDALAMALQDLSGAIAESGATVSAAKLPVVHGDAAQLASLFQNLVGNSIKYASKGIPPQVNITCTKDSLGNWLIQVQDNGIGVAQEYLELIFRPFKRLHGREIPGTGIGLALCRRIVESHGGRISVESRPGEGSTFSFTLPAAAPSR
jgi:two-component system sensor histidine kinase/response regulator